MLWTAYAMQWNALKGEVSCRKVIVVALFGFDVITSQQVERNKQYPE
jgi:hypothetical protein